MNKSILRLFNGVLVTSENQCVVNDKLLRKCIKNGFVFSPEILISNELIDEVISVLGLNGKQLNASFHKSWQKVRDADIEQLVVEQIIHYFTTYGTEALGLYNQNMVYIPVEKLKIPKVDIDKVQLVTIRGFTKSELKSKLLELLGSGVALSQDAVMDAVEVGKLVGLELSDVEGVRNKEVRVALYDHFQMVPSNNVEFIRFLVFKTTGKTLLIKNDETFSAIKASTFDVSNLLKQYQQEFGLANLAKVFYRFKPIFLAFKKGSSNSIINNIRRLAVRCHEPLKEDYINCITAKLKRGVKINEVELCRQLAAVNIFRKIKLLYALQYRSQSADSIVYKIRNGKGYATDFQFHSEQLESVQRIVQDSIVGHCASRLKGKKVYIPNGVVYALPSTEKQFVDKIPAGSYVSISKDVIVGVHWENVENHRIDLDLSLLGVGKKFGWDGSYRDDKVLFSGDMTSAPLPDGASELFYINQAIHPCFVILNYFNYEQSLDVPCQLFLAHQKLDRVTRNYMVDPNKVIVKSNININRRQKILGLLVQEDNATRFYFIGTDIGNSITSYGNDYIEKARNYLVTFYQNAIPLNDILQSAGVQFTNESDCEINLSPEKLDKSTIIDLLG